MAPATAVCDYLQSRSFAYHSLSDEIREKLARAGRFAFRPARVVSQDANGRIIRS